MHYYYTVYYYYIFYTSNRYCMCFAYNQEQKRPYSAGGMSAVNKSAEDGGPFSSKVINSVFIILLLDLLGFTLILPLLPSILDHYAQTGVSLVVFFQEITSTGYFQVERE